MRFLQWFSAELISYSTNKMQFPTKSKKLELYPLEDVLIAPIISSMTICELPVGGQNQYEEIYTMYQ